MDLAIKVDKFAAVGVNRMGKTTGLLNAIETARPRFAFVFVFDHKHMIGPKVGKPIAFTKLELVKQLEEAAKAGKGWVIFSGNKMFPDNPEAAIDFFTRLVCRAAVKLPLRKRKVFVCDELGEVVNKKKDMGPAYLPGLLSINQSMRFHNVSFFFAAQALNEVSLPVRNQVNWLRVYRTNDPSAFTYIRGRVDVRKITTLEVGQFEEDRY